MRTIDDIIADSHKTQESALREAFEAGRAHATSDLKSRLAAFFEGPAQPAPPHEEPQPAPQNHEHHTEQHYD